MVIQQLKSNLLFVWCHQSNIYYKGQYFVLLPFYLSGYFMMVLYLYFIKFRKEKDKIIRGHIVYSELCINSIEEIW